MPRPLGEQVVVLCGASSGVGRETALMLGGAGSKLVLAARDEQALIEVKREVERLGGKAHVVVTDVAQWAHVQRLAEDAERHFGRIDTWVNGAAVSVYGTVEETPVEDIQQAIQVILLGQIHGMKAAIPALKRNGQGTIINVASALAIRSVPLQAAYCAAKHGIKGFTESLRMELMHEKSNINVTLVLPSSINTPLFEHAKSHLGVKPQPMPPIYEPRVVAEVILHAAQHPMRDIVVGGGGKMLTLMERISPALMDRFMVMRGQMFKKQKTNKPDDGRDNLSAPMPGTDAATGQFGSRSKSTSIYTRALELHPARKTMALAASTLGLVALIRGVGR